MVKIITKELIESSKAFIKKHLGLNMALIENLIGLFTDAIDNDLESSPSENILVLDLKDLLLIIHTKLPITLFDAEFITLVNQAGPKQKFIFEISVNDLTQSNKDKFIYHFRYYALKNKSYKSPVFETLISEKERKQLIKFFAKQF